jgi:predicted ATP-grasp superfamily ATP-dependent carboligase
MINFIVVGNTKAVVVGVLQSIRTFTDAKAVVIGSEATAGLRWSSLCEGHSTLSFDGSDDDMFVNIVHSLVKRTPHMVLVPADPDAMRLTNRVRSRLPLKIVPVPDTGTITTLQDARLFNQFCKQQLLPVPATCVVNAAAELDFHAIASRLGVPFAIRTATPCNKPVTQIVHNKEDLEKAALHSAFQHGALVCRAHIDGSDISMHLIADRGQISAFSMQQSDERNASRIRFVSNAALEETAMKLCRASAYNGPLHLRARIDQHTGNVFLIDAVPHFPESVTATVLGGLNLVAESIEPTPRINGVRRLTEGVSHASHPLACPSLWSSLLSDSSERGRLLRVMMFDLYTFGQFVGGIPRTVFGSMATQIACWRAEKFSVAPRLQKSRGDTAAPAVNANFVGDF